MVVGLQRRHTDGMFGDRARDMPLRRAAFTAS